MRPALVAWLLRHEWPGWLAPDYMVMVGLAGLIGATLLLWLSRRDGADVRAESRVLLGVYAGALGGGYLAEGLRALPVALSEGSLWPVLLVGRAAYGGLLTGTLVALFLLRRSGMPVRPFLDRMVPLLGVTFAFVRTGCFLAGCDYGRPTGSLFGVRFPAGSPAAVDHAALGWVPLGFESLPVHPTQLYEAALGILACGVASLWLLRGHRDGRAFATWVALYASGRFGIERLRGDATRGIYAGLSTAQIVSLLLLVIVAISLVSTRLALRRRAAVASITGLALFAGFGTTTARAQAPAPSEGPPIAAPPPTGAAVTPVPPPEGPPIAVPPAPPPSDAPATTPPSPAAPGTAAPSVTPPPYPYPPYPYPYPYPPYPYPYPPYPYPYPSPYPYSQPPAPPSWPVAAPAKPRTPARTGPDLQSRWNRRRMDVTLSTGMFWPPALSSTQTGIMVGLDAMVHLQASLGEVTRFQLGAGLHVIRTPDATHVSARLPVALVFGLSRYAELLFGVAFGAGAILFDSPYLHDASVFSGTLEVGLQFPVRSNVSVGFAPVVLSILGSGDINTLVVFEPKFLTLSVAFP